MLRSLLFAVLGSIGITATATALGASAEVLVAMLPVHFVWGFLCGVIFD
ncbi:hypothetical protein [Klebsiella phage BUCT86]|uniref:Uncharacterized protein n=1 Tax=Klebsiella phage BUCT86 TaxID=2900302 RepID=A0AAE9C756_9CAUD|nr:hypothetical protein [Klebsiella phage BUCT86]